MEYDVLRKRENDLKLLQRLGKKNINKTKERVKYSNNKLKTYFNGEQYDVGTRHNITQPV